MGTVAALTRIFYRLPPAGEPVIIPGYDTGVTDADAVFAPYSACFYGSATSALAASLVAAVARTDTSTPEVLLPAYGCPALVSAVLFAGARPRLVDLEPDRPWMDLDALRSALGRHTAAVVAVDLFGIPERYAAIREVLADTGVVLIQDSAQALPPPNDSGWAGDYVILSFGRGKPVSLLHGGAVLAQEENLLCALPRPPEAGARRTHGSLVSRARLYNLLSSAWLYWLPAGLPFLGLGQTHYRPLAAIEAADPELMEWLPINLRAHWRRNESHQLAIQAILGDWANACIVDLPQACGWEGANFRLLRYPLLVCDARVRERLFRCCARRGLGASAMYPLTLPRVAGLEQIFAGVSCPQADSFAKRIMTLPVHSRVRPSDIQTMRECFADAGIGTRVVDPKRISSNATF